MDVMDHMLRMQQEDLLRLTLNLSPGIFDIKDAVTRQLAGKLNDPCIEGLSVPVKISAFDCFGLRTRVSGGTSCATKLKQLRRYLRKGIS
jgi:hypothetical protein